MKTKSEQIADLVAMYADHTESLQAAGLLSESAKAEIQEALKEEIRRLDEPDADYRSLR